MQIDLWQYLNHSTKPILLYGMGNGADSIIKRLQIDNTKVAGVFASDNFVRGQFFHNMPVLTYNEAKERFKDFIVLVAFGTPDEKVIDNIKSIALEQELYIPDVPVYGDTVFDSKYLNDNLEDIKFIEKSFADERSALVFKNIIDFKLNGKISSLFASTDEEEKTLKQLISLPQGAKIFDLGAYIGDTAEKFLKLYPECEKIIAVEPDPKNFSRLNAAKPLKTECVNAAISYLDGAMFFSSEGGRNQTVNSGKNMISTVTIDSLSRQFSAPDMIKFDIEGQELNGLIGGEETIKKYKPALLISTYHRSEDIISIPKKVLSLRSDYKMYIRRFPCVPCWDLYYIFI